MPEGRKRTPRGDDFSTSRKSVPLDSITERVVEKVAARHGLSRAEVLSRVARWMCERPETAWALVLQPLPEQFVPQAVADFAEDVLRSQGLVGYTVSVHPPAESDIAKGTPPEADPKPSGGRPPARRARLG